MKKFSKLCAVLCAGALALSLSGCGGEQNTTKTSDKKVQIEYWHDGGS